MKFTAFLIIHTTIVLAGVKQRQLGAGLRVGSFCQTTTNYGITDINKDSAVPYSTSSSFALEIPGGYSVPACCLHCCLGGRKQKQILKYSDSGFTEKDKLQTVKVQEDLMDINMKAKRAAQHQQK